MTRTLHVRIESPDRSDLEERLEAIDAGEDVDPGETTLSIENLETFGRVFRSTNLELVAAIVEHEPESIRKLPRPTPSLTRCARSVLEDGAFRGFPHLPSRPRAGRGVDARRRFTGGSVRPGLATPHRLQRRVRDGRPKNGVVGSLEFNSRWTRTGTFAVQGRALVPEFGASLRWPVHRFRFGPDALLHATVSRTKTLANALPPRPTRSLRSFVEAGASALPRGEPAAVGSSPPTGPNASARLLKSIYLQNVVRSAIDVS